MKNKNIRKYLLTLAAFVLTVVGAGAIYTVVHASTISVTEIDYEKLTLTVQATEADSKIFYAASKTASTWDEIPGDLDENHQITMDISWVSLSKDYTLYLKGDKAADPIQVTLPKQNTKFKAALNTEKSEFTFSNKGSSDVIYWRKSTSTEWKVFNQSEMKNLLESYSLKGISLVFCAGQVKGTSAGSPGERPSKISTVKVTKRASAPGVTFNYGTMTFSVKNTMEYKLSENSEWAAITDTTLSLKDVMPQVLYDNGGKDMGEDETVGIDFRLKATTKKVASQTKTLKISRQEDTPTDNILYAATGSKQLELQVIASGSAMEASSGNPYEYTVVKEGEELDIYTAKWTAMTSKTTQISDTTAPAGSSIYVRKKSTGTNLPGKERKIVEKVQYIDASTLNQETKLVKIQGTEKEGLSFIVCINNKDAKVSSVAFNGTKAGFKAADATLLEGTDKYAITVTVTDTTAIESIAANLGTDLIGKITLSNGDVIESGVTLYIQKAATIASKSYTTYAGYGFIDGNVSGAALTFDIALNKEDATERADAAIDSITYNGVEVTGYTTTNPDGEEDTIRVTVPNAVVSGLSDNVVRSKYGTAYSLVVNLKNGEKLENIKLTVAYSVKVSSSNSSFGISKGSYQSSVTQTTDSTANSGGYTKPEITYTIQKEVYELDPTYGLEKLEWNGVDVLDSFSGSSNVFKATVSLAKLTQDSTGTGSRSIVATFKNDSGERITVDYGYQITVVS